MQPSQSDLAEIIIAMNVLNIILLLYMWFVKTYCQKRACSSLEKKGKSVEFCSKKLNYTMFRHFREFY